jgi:hypothetical protein
MSRQASPRTKGPARPRGRFVSRSIAVNEQLAGVSLQADYLFRACIPHLDVEGCVTGNPALLRSIVAPLRAEIGDGVVPDLLRELANATDHTGTPLIFWYEINGTNVVKFPGFERQQQGLRKDREAPSKFPSRNGKEVLLHKRGATPDQLHSIEGGDRAEVVVEGEVEVEGVSAQRTYELTVVDQLLADMIRVRVGQADWQVVEAFLDRRPPDQRHGWLDAMARETGPGSQSTGAHLLAVCRDDMVNAVKHPRGLRAFLATARAEALNPSGRRVNGGGDRNDPVLQRWLDQPSDRETDRESDERIEEDYWAAAETWEADSAEPGIEAMRPEPTASSEGHHGE